ncbi:hypothetical protein CE91St44_00260 [Oscillospiraceae bacterium]|nr:hypothetical protein CE91St44_00260 [Oscillospiraceae bacterium]
MEDRETPFRAGARRLLCAVLLAVFCLLCLAAFCRGENGYLPAAAELLWAGAALLALLTVRRCARRAGTFFKRWFPWVLGGLCGAFFAAQLVLGFKLRFEPEWDMLAMYQGGISWGTMGRLTEVSAPTFDAATYFYYFPNNLGGAGVLAAVFKISSMMGLTDFFWSAMTVNGLLCTAALAVTALAARELAGETAGLLAAAAFLLCPPVWFAAPVFYSDFLSFLFPVLAVWLFLKARKQKSAPKRLLLLLLCCAAAGLGVMIKATVGIVLIALGMGVLLMERPRRFAAFCLTALLGVGLWQGALGLAVYPRQLSRAEADRLNTPLLHWTMMSLQGDGGYDPASYEFTRSFSDKSERRAQVARETLARLQKLGPKGFFALADRKWQRCFGNGTLNLSDMLDDAPATPCSLHDFLLPGGAGYQGYKALCNGVQLCFLALAAALCARGAMQKRMDFAWLLAPLCLCGLALFLLFWETSCRYITNFTPLLFLCAALALSVPTPPKEQKA